MVSSGQRLHTVEIESMESLEAIKLAAIAAVGQASTPQELEQLRVEYLGKKGALTGLLKTLGGLSAEERPQAGALINTVKQEISGVLNERRAGLEQAALQQKLEAWDHPRDHPGKYLYYAGTFLAVSSQPLQIAQRDFGMSFMCV